jgi:hypothetical protein
MKDKSSNKAKTIGIVWWKKAAFALGVLMVIGAVTYSLAIRPTASAGNPPATGSAPAVANPNSSAPPSNGIAELNWTKNLKTRFVDQDFMFVILPGSSDLTKKIYPEMDRAVAKIKADGVRIDTLTLNSDDPELAITAQRLAITKLPAVIAFNSMGSGALVNGEITETKLLQAYLQAVKACALGSSSGCCP